MPRRAGQSRCFHDRRAARGPTLAVFAVMLLCGLAHAQPEPGPADSAVGTIVPVSADAADADVEQYLESRGLTAALAAHLRGRLKTATGDERLATVEKLGSLYVRLLGQTNDPGERQSLEDRSRELLRAAPESESFELRINLAKATYLQAETIAESDRLRVATQDQRQEAERILRSVLPTFREVGQKVASRVQALERREQVAADDQAREIREQLAAARRVRSLAMYYAGWSGYYLALLTRDGAFASQASEDFGWILNSGGAPANIEKLPKDLLRFEHIARAAVGAGLCAAVRGNEVEAMRWLDAVAGAPQLPDPVRAQLFSRRIAVLAAAGRWSDVSTEVRRARLGAADGSVKPLSVQDARLLAVLGLDARASGAAGSRAADATDALVQIALSDLIAQGEAGHVLDIVRLSGTAPLGNEGFIVHYVRGLQGYERAREAHAKSGRDAEPTADPAVANLYREAGNVLRLAVESRDAGAFRQDFGLAWLRRGLCAYYAGELPEAARQFAAAIDAGIGEPQRREAMWFAVVSLDKAVEAGAPAFRADRDALASKFLESYPESDQAAQLLLRDGGRGLLAPEEGVRRLLRVEPGSPLYATARRRAASTLFDMFRAAPADRRSSAAARFLGVAAPLLESERDEAGSDDPAIAQAAGPRLILRARQIADASLSMSPPDPDAAARALDAVESIAALRGLDLSSIRDEIAYRRLQIAAARGDAAEESRLSAEIFRQGGPFVRAASAMIFERRRALLDASPDDPAIARQVVNAGAKLLESFRPPAAATDPAQPNPTQPAAPSDPHADPAADPIRAAVAAAATVVWTAQQDRQMLALAVELDRAVTSRGVGDPRVLRRLANNLEASGDPAAAARVWTTLLGGLDPAMPDWYEARFQSLRLLAQFDVKAAGEILRQHVLVHPEYGPDPWGPMLRTLDQSVNPAKPAGGGGA